MALTLSNMTGFVTGGEEELTDGGGIIVTSPVKQGTYAFKATLALPCMPREIAKHSNSEGAHQRLLLFV